MPNTDYSTVVRMADEVPARVTDLQVINQTDYNKATGILRDIVTIRKGVEEHHGPRTKQAYDAWQAQLTEAKVLLTPLATAETRVKQAIGLYETRQRQEQERLAREAREEEERQAQARRREEIAEAERQAREQIAQMIEDAPDEETAQAILDRVGEAVTGAVAEVAAEPLPVQAYVVPQAVRKVTGVSSIAKWTCKVVDVRELCLAVGNDDAPVEYVMGLEKDKGTGIVTSPALNRIAGVLGKEFRVAGCRAVEGTVVRARGR